MAQIAAAADSGEIVPGAMAMPTTAVNTASDITRGFIRAIRSPGRVDHRPRRAGFMRKLLICMVPPPRSLLKQ
jgi:hypothetical protein